MLSNQQIQNNWPTIKSQVLSKWSKLSEAEVEKTHGDNSTLGKLVHNKYGNNEEFDRAYASICNNFSSQADGVPDFENRLETAPAAEAGMSEYDSRTTDDTFQSGSPERRANSNFGKVENTNDSVNQEVNIELSHYNKSSRTSEVNKNNTNNTNKHFSAPDEFYPSQDPSFSSEDVILGRKISSATKISTAKAAPISSEASRDARKKI